MTRLTNSMREQIVTALLKHRFATEITALIKERATFAEAVYNDIFKKSDREKMQSLPEGWLCSENHISVRFGEGHWGYQNLSFNGSYSSKLNRIAEVEPASIYRLLPQKHSRGCAAVYAEDSKICIKYNEISNKIDALIDEVNEAEIQVKAGLSKATTIAGLIKSWPEIEPFTKSFSKTKSNLPAIPTSTLNSILDLPVAA